jgi:uncharacterized protein (TIGR02266 family)
VITGEGSQRYYSKNISAGGVFLLADDPLPPETIVELEVMFPDLKEPIKATGEVVWNRIKDPRGFAVKFTEISDVSREFISWAIKRQLS